MKKLSLLTLFFFVTSFASPQRAHANPLLVVPAAVLGANPVVLVGALTLTAAAAGVYYAKSGIAPQYVPATPSAPASASDKIFSPSLFAVGPFPLVTAATFPAAANYYLGKSAWVGASIGNLIAASKNAAAGVCDTFKSMVAARTQSGPYPADMTGYNLTCDPAKNSQCTSGKVATLSSPYSPVIGPTVAFGDQATADAWIASHEGFNSNGTLYYVYSHTLVTLSQYYQEVHGTRYTVTYITGTPTAIPPDGTVDYGKLRADLFPWLTTNPIDIQNLIKSLPGSQVQPSATDTVPASVDAAPPAPTAITPAEKTAALQDVKVQAAQAAQTAAQTAVANNATPQQLAQIDINNNTATTINEAAEQAAQAQDQAQTPPDVYSPISDNPFSKPITTEPFDIPNRFQTFIGRVKSSPICSFSQSFFNSLPGGGSPVFTIDGGYYFGLHTIDLSQTFSPGLAVLKSIFLICFAFLSIRAVIMKR